jgi:chloramphenicol-sensitive protein RarD
MPIALPLQSERSRLRTGVIYALGAFSAWGLLVPIHFKMLTDVPAFEILAHRILWGCVFACALLWMRQEVGDLRQVLRPSRHLAMLSLSAALVGINWYVYIWAVNAGYLVQTSLGYFINPLVNVVLGVLFLRERLQVAQIAACLLATLGVLILAVSSGALPWIALTLAVSFGFYGLVRKVVPVAALTGFCVESLILVPIATAYVAWTITQGHSILLLGDLALNGLLLLTGVSTAAPLIWFAEAARRLKLSTVGLLQYLSPTGQLILGVLAYGEPFSWSQGAAFGVIWVALVIYSISAFRSLEASRAGTAPSGQG